MQNKPCFVSYLYYDSHSLFAFSLDRGNIGCSHLQEKDERKFLYANICDHGSESPHHRLSKKAGETITIGSFR